MITPCCVVGSFSQEDETPDDLSINVIGIKSETDFCYLEGGNK